MQFNSESELMAYAKKLEGRRFSEICDSIGKLDENHRKHTKGVAAKVIETEYFGIPSNSSERPDFEELGIEPRILFDLVDRREFALRLRGYLTAHAREETGGEYWLSIRDKSAVEVGGEVRYSITFKVDADTPDDLVTQFYELVRMCGPQHI